LFQSFHYICPVLYFYKHSIVFKPKEPTIVLKVRLIIFDFDGTLADTYPWFMGVINRAADHFKLKKIDVSDLDSVRAESTKKMIKRFGIPLWKIQLIARRVRQWMGDDIDEIHLFRGVRDLLISLHERGTSLAILTSNSCANVRRVLGPELTGCITYWECDVSMSGKRRRMKKILRRSGIPPEHCLAVGDEIRDFQAAHKAGIPFGGVAWGYNSMEALAAHGASRIFGSIDEMISFLLEPAGMAGDGKSD